MYIIDTKKNTNTNKTEENDMKNSDIKEIGGYLVIKTNHPTFRNRDGYAKRCYAVCKNMEDWQSGKNVTYYISMADVKEHIKVMNKK